MDDKDKTVIDDDSSKKSTIDIDDFGPKSDPDSYSIAGDEDDIITDDEESKRRFSNVIGAA